MARRKLSGALDDMLAGHNEEKPQKTTEISDRGELKVYHIRLYEGHWKRLQEHFEDQGVPCSTGIRQVLANFLKENGL